MKRGRFALGVGGALLAGGCARAATSADRFAELYRALHPSVVFVKMRAPSSDPKAHRRIDDAYGTAFVIASDAGGTTFVTAKHVIEEATDLHATFGDKLRSSQVKIVATDDRYDLALLHSSDVRNIAVAPLGESDGILPGEAVGVIGYPIPDAFQDEGLGLSASIYSGHVAGIRKESIELDLAIIPGESGGPVFLARSGKVIGIAESRFEEEHAIGFATPIDLVKPFLRAHRQA